MTNMENVLWLEGRRNGYGPEQCGCTFTVGELIDWLSQFDEDAKVYINNDGGYTYGSIDERSFWTPEEEEWRD